MNLDFGSTYETVFDFSAAAKSELIILCPYIKVDAFNQLVGHIPKNLSVKIVCRWQLHDLVGGSSDLEVFESAKKAGYEFYIHSEIHLKVLLRDGEHILVGSANVTNPGLGIADHPNIEAVAVNEITDFADVARVRDVVRESTRVDGELYSRFREAVKKFKEQMVDEKQLLREMKNETENLVHETDGLLVRDFPVHDTPAEAALVSHKGGKSPDAQFVSRGKAGGKVIPSSENLNPQILEEIRRSFVNGPAFRWQETLFSDTDAVRFGEYTAKLHDSLTDDPVPYRTTVKDLVSRMMRWTETLVPEYSIKSYEHTQALVCALRTRASSNQVDAPQADDLYKVIQLVILVSQGVADSEQIAERLEFTSRQSGYYAHAAHDLNLISIERGRYSLTDSGRKLIDLGVREREKSLSDLLKNFPLVAYALKEVDSKSKITEDELETVLEKHSVVTGATRTRRARTLFRWLEWVCRFDDEYVAIGKEIRQR